MHDPEIQPLLNFYKSKLSVQFRNLTRLLEQYYGIDYFCYRWISPEGNFFRIANPPSDTEFYFSNNFHKTSVFNRHPDNFSNAVYQPSAVINNAYQQDQTKAKLQIGLQVEQTFIISKKRESCAHLFSFGTKNSNLHLTAIALNNLSMFDYFCDFLMSQWNFLQMDPFIINIAKLIGKKVFQKREVFYYGIEIDRKQKFLQKFSCFEDFASEFFTLSQRERECMILSEQGLTMNEMAKLLHISSRTIEHHMESIKSKLECNNKAEIFSKIKYFRLVGLM